jgi:hypothetical protein
MISGVQQFDQLLVSALGSTCGFGLSPINGWYCVGDGFEGTSPFGSKYGSSLITLIAICSFPLAL